MTCTEGGCHVASEPRGVQGLNPCWQFSLLPTPAWVLSALLIGPACSLTIYVIFLDSWNAANLDQLLWGWTKWIDLKLTSLTHVVSWSWERGVLPVRAEGRELPPGCMQPHPLARPQTWAKAVSELALLPACYSCCFLFHLLYLSILMMS